MLIRELITEAVIDYTLDNYTTMPRFTDSNLGRLYKLNDIVKLRIPPNLSTAHRLSKLYKNHEPGTLLRVLGRILNDSGQHSIVVNPVNTNEVYRIYGYYLQPADEELHPPIKRLKKKLTGTLDCGNCGKTFSLEVPGSVTHRDHCPFCLYSVHIDNRPGDRNAWCGYGTHENWIPSKLVPIGRTDSRVHPSIVYRCEKCDAIKVNRYADDDNRHKINQLQLYHIAERSKKLIPIEK